MFDIIRRSWLRWMDGLWIDIGLEQFARLKLESLGLRTGVLADACKKIQLICLNYCSIPVLNYVLDRGG